MIAPLRIALVAAIALAAVASCKLPTAAAATLKVRPNEGVGGVRLGDDRKRVDSRWGLPFKQRACSPSTGFCSRFYRHRGAVLRVDYRSPGQTVFAIRSSSSNLTLQGVRLESGFATVSERLDDWKDYPCGDLHQLLHDDPAADEALLSPFTVARYRDDRFENVEVSLGQLGLGCPEDDRDSTEPKNATLRYQSAP